LSHYLGYRRPDVVRDRISLSTLAARGDRFVAMFRQRVRTDCGPRAQLVMGGMPQTTVVDDGWAGNLFAPRLGPRIDHPLVSVDAI